MNRVEAARAIEVRQVLWPSTPAPGDAAVEVDVWATMLGRFDVDVVIAVMQAKKRETFAPTVGQIEEAIDPTPSYADVLAEFQRMSRSYSTTYHAPESIPWSHPLIRAAACSGLWKAWGESPDSRSDPDATQAEAAFRAHFRESFKGVAARHIARDVLPALTGKSHEQIVSGGQRQIER